MSVVAVTVLLIYIFLMAKNIDIFCCGYRMTFVYFPFGNMCSKYFDFFQLHVLQILSPILELPLHYIKLLI